MVVSPYTSARWMHTTAHANLCSSPPLRSSIFLSLTRSRSEDKGQQIATHQQKEDGKQLTKTLTDLFLNMKLILPIQHALNCALYCSRDLVHVLRLNTRLHSGNTVILHLSWLHRHTKSPWDHLPGFWWSNSAVLTLWSMSVSPANQVGSNLW